MDGRSLHQFRDLQVNFGRTFGSVYVQLGQTVVFASTEAVVAEPRLTRPSEGRFRVNMNISAGGKDRWLKTLERTQPTEAVLTMRLLEKIINRINVLDLESLCLVVGKRVWCITTSIVLFNADGNLVEAASIATIASLMHFRRPDATVTPEGDIIVHSLEERPPLPLTLFHYPLCVTFQFMDASLLAKIISDNQEHFPEELLAGRLRKAAQLMVTDPTEEEEDVLRNVLVVCANTYGEIVAIQSLGRLSLTTSGQLLKDCTAKAFERVRFVTDYLKAEVAKVKAERYSGKQLTASSLEESGFYSAMRTTELCIARDYMRNPIFGGKPGFGGNNNSFTLPAADEDLSVKNRKSNSKATEEDLSIFLRSHRQANKIGEGGLSKWGIEPALKIHNDDAEVEDGDEEDEEEKEEDENASQLTASAPSNNNSYANILGPRGSKQQQQKQQISQWNVQPTTIKAPLSSGSEINRQQQQSQEGAPNVQLKQKADNSWTKVEGGKKGAKEDAQLQAMSKSQKKKFKKKEKEAAVAEMAKWKKIPTRLSDEDEDEEDGDVVQLKSEYQA